VADDRYRWRYSAWLSRVVEVAEEKLEAIGEDDNPSKDERHFVQHFCSLCQLMARDEISGEARNEVS
jgi:hypothetical protein